MPKRKSEDRLIKKYQAKIRKLEKKQDNRRRRIILYSDSESDLENEEIESHNNDESLLNAKDHHDQGLESTTNFPAEVLDTLASENPFAVDPASTEPGPPPIDETVSELDPEIRLALGDPVVEIPVYGESIHADLAKLWLPILRKGLTKDVKEKLLKGFYIPNNCKLLKAPSLNPEIAAAVAEVVRTRDKKIEAKQDQLGLGITAISKAMSVFLADGNKLEVIKLLSEGCRILSDLHYVDTQTRSKLITPCLDRTFLNIIQDDDRDETLFGTKLTDKIKSAKVIEKQGLQIKRNTPVIPRSNFPQQASTRRQAGNWIGPPRYPMSVNRGGRGGYTVSRYAPSTSYRRTQTQVSTTPSSLVRAPPPTTTNKHPTTRSRVTRQ